jgi:hypothetical protein
VDITKETEVNLEKILDMLPFQEGIPALQRETFAKDFLVYIGDKYTILPELLLILTLPQILQLVYVFSDQTLKIPDKKNMENAIRDISIFYAIKENPEHKTVKALSEQYNLTIQATLWIIEKVCNKFEVPNPLKN